jgi:hypothetical protein
MLNQSEKHPSCAKDKVDEKKGPSTTKNGLTFRIKTSNRNDLAPEV